MCQLTTDKRIEGYGNQIVGVGKPQHKFCSMGGHTGHGQVEVQSIMQ